MYPVGVKEKMASAPEAVLQITGDRIRVLIADDQAMVRSGLRYFLLAFDDLELVGEATSGAQALEMCAQVRPDVVLMDLLMPGLDAASATRAIRQRFPRVRVIVMSGFWAEKRVQGVLEAGAIGYLVKNVSAGELADAIRAAHVGRPISASEEARVTTNSPVPCFGLTPRQGEVLALVLEELDNAEIAERLAISVSTVKFHVSNVLSKMDVSSRAEAAALVTSSQGWGGTRL